jgi:hypothetical protein
MFHDIRMSNNILSTTQKAPERTLKIDKCDCIKLKTCIAKEIVIE